MVAFIRIDGVFTLKDHIYRDAEGYVYRTLGLRLWEKTTPMGVGLSSGRPARLISFQLTVCHPCPFQPVEGPAALPSGKPTIFKDPRPDRTSGGDEHHEPNLFPRLA